MLIVHVTVPGSFGLAVGERYVMDGHTAGQYLVEGWGTVVPSGPFGALTVPESGTQAGRAVPLPGTGGTRKCPSCWGAGKIEVQKEPYERMCIPCGGKGELRATGTVALREGLLLMRAGGFGDLVCLRPIIEAWQEWSCSPEVDGGARVGVCAHRSHWDALVGLEHVELIPYPMPASALEGWERVVDLSGVIEREDAVTGWDSVEALARAVFPQADQRFFDGLVPEMPVFHEEMMEALRRWPRREATGTVALRVGIALSASARCRTWPLERVGELVRALGTGVEVFLLGAPGPWPEIRLEGPVRHIHVLPRLGLTMRQSLAVMSTLDCLVAPDTGLLHAAGALGIPAVGIFGPFLASQRVARYGSVRVIQGVAPCAPCAHHPRTWARTWPVGKPCGVMGHCVAMASTTGERVAAVVREILECRMTNAE